MKKTLIIVALCVLVVCAICLGAVILNWSDPGEQVPVDLHTPNNIVEVLGIERSDTRLERLFAITTYQGQASYDELINDLINMGQVTSFEYLELDDRSNDYLLITPFEINGVLEIATLRYDSWNERYVRDEVVFTGNNGKRLPENYSLLLRYSRPSIPQYEIKLTQKGVDGEFQTATYHILNVQENGEPVKTIQRIKDDIDPGTDERLGVPIKLFVEEY